MTKNNRVNNNGSTTDADTDTDTDADTDTYTYISRGRQIMSSDWGAAREQSARRYQQQIREATTANYYGNDYGNDCHGVDAPTVWLSTPQTTPHGTHSKTASDNFHCLAVKAGPGPIPGNVFPALDTR